MTAKTLDRHDLLNHLWALQRRHGHIRTQDVAIAARKLQISEIELEGIISFYHFFRRRPVGRNVVYLSNSVIARLKGFKRVREALEEHTGQRFGVSQPGGAFSLFETACIGLSDAEPAALINFQPFTHLNSLKVREIVNNLRLGADAADICDTVPQHIRRTPEAGRTILLRDYQPGLAVAALRGLSPEAVIEQVSASGLCGMGGAFFPVGQKWAACRAETAARRFVVCNADEGEPGTFKDRVLLDTMPGLLLEGMIIAGYAAGAAEGVIYLRAEYTWLLPKLESSLSRFRKMNLLGRNIAGIEGFDFDIHVQLGAGAYVCGEETALLNSLEGKRGEPRAKRFYPTQRGLFGLPTVVNNVETLCAAARVLELGVETFRSAGTPASPGTKLLSVSGDCRLPGIYEIEWGTRLGDLLSWCRADEPLFIQVSGPSGECVSMAEVDRRFALDDLRCGGSVMIFNRARDLLRVLRHFNAFFRSESCGLCTPCRAGNFILHEKLRVFASGLVYPEDCADLDAWGEIMRRTCRCGLGQSAPNAIRSALQKFPEYFGALTGRNCDGVNMGFDLEAATREYERFSS